MLPDIIDNINKHLLNKHNMLYKGKMSVEKEGDSYTLLLNLNNQDRPLVIAGEFDSDEEFTTYANKELDNKKPFLTEYFILKMELPPN